MNDDDFGAPSQTPFIIVGVVAGLMLIVILTIWCFWFRLISRFASFLKRKPKIGHPADCQCVDCQRAGGPIQFGIHRHYHGGTPCRCDYSPTHAVISVQQGPAHPAHDVYLPGGVQMLSPPYAVSPSSAPPYAGPPPDVAVSPAVAYPPPNPPISATEPHHEPGPSVPPEVAKP